MSEFLNMGGYAFYVWSSFGLTALVLTLNVVLTRNSLRRARLQALRRIKAMETQRAPKT